MSNDLLTTQQLAEALGARNETVYAWQHRGWITPEKGPGQRKYSLESVVDGLKKRSQQSNDGRTKYSVAKFLDHIARSQGMTP